MPDARYAIHDRIPKLRRIRVFMEERKGAVRARLAFQFHRHLVRDIRFDVVILRGLEMKNICDGPGRIKHRSVRARFPCGGEGGFLWATVERMAAASERYHVTRRQRHKFSVTFAENLRDAAGPQ
ncbi:MAG TPA: hypothetical protein VFO36_12135, partial [Nitrospiraceae bacterium]|nr:hypothetical protein [Nitrospiraceae bacterium]